MASDKKYDRLMNQGESWWQFGCFHLGKWTEDFPEVEQRYNNLRKHRKDLPEWPITVFGPADDIRRLPRWDDLLEELVDGVKRELQEPKDQTFPTMTEIRRALKEAHLISEASKMNSLYFKNFLRVVETDADAAKAICFACIMAKIRVASPPGTRKFLQQIQDMVLTHCDPPNPRRRPLLAVQTAHHKLDTRTVLNALNLATMYSLKKMGNVRACKNWAGEKRDELREYRKHLFQGCKASGRHSWVPSTAILCDYDFDVAFDEVAQPHPVQNDPDDGQETPPRSASPRIGDPFWGDIFHVGPAPETESSSEDPSDSNTDKQPALTALSAPVGKNAARNKRKADRKRLRKSAQEVVDSVFHHSGAGTPVGPAEEEATRATTPAPAPPVLTDREKKEARKAKIKAKKQRRKQRKAGGGQQEAHQLENEEVTPIPSPAPSSPPYSPPPAATPPRRSSTTLGHPHPPSPIVVPAVSAASSVAILTPTSSAAPASPPAPRPVSPLRNSRLVSPSGIPLPLFWALDVESLQEDTFPAAGPDPDD